MSETKLKSYLGIDIYIDTNDGRFTAVINGMQQHRTSLKAIESEIRKREAGVEVIALHASYGNRDLPQTPVVERVMQVDHGFLMLNARERIWRNAYIFDQLVLNQLLDMVRQFESARTAFEKEWENRWKEVTGKLQPVRSDVIAEQIRAARATQPSDNSH